MKKEIKKVPTIRFKGFTDDWEQRKLGELFSSLQNNTFSREDLNDENGMAQNIHYGDVLIKYDECLDVSKEKLDYIDKIYIVNKFQKSFLKNGDVVVADTAEDETVGKCTEIQGISKEKIISGLHTMPLRPVQKFGTGYLGFYMNSNSYHDQLKPLMQGIKVTSISKGAMADTIMKYPINFDEQQKIGVCFQLFNALITLHQRKLKQLQALKKYFLQNMFPAKEEKVPAIRFKGFTGDWEQKKITDISKIFIGLVTTMTENYRDQGTLLIRNSDIRENQFSFSNTPIFLKETFAEENKTRRLKLGDVITVHTGDIGTSAIITKNEVGAIGFATINTRPNKEILDSYYLAAFFNTKQHKTYALRMATGDGRSNYNLKDFKKLVIPLPSIAEQKKIGGCFQNLYHLIIFQQHKINQLQSLKKFMLQNLFI